MSKQTHMAVERFSTNVDYKLLIKEHINHLTETEMCGFCFLMIIWLTFLVPAQKHNLFGFCENKKKAKTLIRFAKLS